MGKRLQKSQTKRNIPIRVAAALLCLTLFSTYLVTGLFARYTTVAQSSNPARVAKFSIDSSVLNGSGSTLSSSIEANLAPGGTGSATIIIENDSEVAVEYTIAVKNMTGNLPLRLRMEKADDPSANLGGTGTTFTAQQAPGHHSDKYKLFMDWVKAEETGDAEKDREAREKELALMGVVDYISVTVTAAQLD